MNYRITALASPTWLKSRCVAFLPFASAGVLAAAMMFVQPAQGAVILLYDFDGQATSNGMRPTAARRSHRLWTPVSSLPQRRLRLPTTVT